jgi:ATP-dependent helicase/nuclease subunit B
LSRRTPAPQRPDRIELIETPDRRGEIDAAARAIRAALEDPAMRFRDIAVLARDLSDYHELIDASFREHGIPFFVDRRRPAAHHPVLQLTRAVFAVAQHPWNNDALMTIAKSGLAGLSLDDTDELENYVLLHRIRGGEAWLAPEPWRFQRKLTRRSSDDSSIAAQANELDRIDASRRTLIDPLIPFVKSIGTGAPLRQIVIALFDLFERLSVRPKLLAWMKAAAEAGEFERHDEHQQVWTELVELFDQMVELLGDEPVSLEQFIEILESGLEWFDLALTPPTVDQVLVGEVERTRTAQVRFAILLGLNDGQFPRASREGSILSDGERRTLRTRNLELDPDTHRRLLDESLLAYLGFTRASHRLMLTRAIADDEARPQSPSMFWRRLRELFPSLVPQRIARGADDFSHIGTPRQLVTALMRWVRNSDHAGAKRSERSERSVAPAPTMHAIYNWLASHPSCDHQDAHDPIDVMRCRAWKGLSYTNEAALSSNVARKLFAAPLRASVSRLETFASCPFKHFVRYGLNLEQREDDDVTVLDLGNVYHAVLERIVKQMLETRSDWASQPPEQAQKLIADYATQIGKELRGELMLSSARNKYILDRIERTLNKVVAAHRAAAPRTKLRPWKAELQFGRGDGIDGALPALELRTPAGATVQIVGKIDRVDVIEDQAAFAVIDYKLSGQSLELVRVYNGLSLQLLTYLLVLQSSGLKLKGKSLTPAAAFYVKLLRKLELAKHPDDASGPEDPLFDLKEKPRGLLDGRFVHSIDTNLNTGKSELVQVHINKRGGFGYRRTMDVADAGEFDALLGHVRRKLGELADQILAGNIAVSPYWLNRDTACPRCDYRSVCRFDSAINRYNPLPSMNREEVLARVLQEARDDA